MPNEPSKKAKINTLSSAAPTGAINTLATTATTKVAAAPEVIAPLTSSSPLIKVQTSEPSIEKEKGAEKEKAKMASKNVKRKTRPNESNASNEDLGENPFHNREIVKDLINKCTLVEVVDKIIDADYEHHTWDSLGSFLEIGHQLITNIKMMNCMRSEVVKAQKDHQAETNYLLEEKIEADHLLKEKIVKVRGLQETIQNIE
ncbi:putative ensconsin-like [Cocos nucifera]|uniref:Putative ensconsin-like n=1 Tax=Cocos nucifera TaxID=13894 RepID=A0A8K0N8P5_COCNU|nr:putative ensconsin-like [Cocos nucifera]